MCRRLPSLVLGFALAGCAGPMTAATTCTNLISSGGGLLNFCQTGDKIRVSEAGIDASRGPAEVTLVDDPLVLSALGKQISPRPDLQASRRLIAHACVVEGKGYVTIAVSDLKRIMEASNRASAIGLREPESVLQ